MNFLTEAILKKIKITVSSGFTLIELLVVMFIIGIVSSIILLTNMNSHSFKESESFAEQLKSQLQIIQQQAVSQIKTLGLFINKTNYEFYVYDENQKKWLPLKLYDDFWKTYVIPPFIELNLTIVERQQISTSSSTGHQPRIIFLPNGEMTTFSLTMYSKGTKRILQIVGSKDGQIFLQELG